MNKCDENNIDVFQSRCLRRILKIRWQERITNKEVLKMAEIEKTSVRTCDGEDGNSSATS